MKDDSTQKILSALESGHGLPVLSPVAMKLVELASDDTSSARDLVDLIEKDPPLAARLLKLANSAFYHSPGPTSSLNQAVVKVGFERLRVMALSISLIDTFPMGKIGPLDYEKFWRMSLYRASISRGLAVHLGYDRVDEAFVAGLLAELGLLLFFEIFIKGKDEQVSLDLEPVQDLLEWERGYFGVDHRQVGKAALKYWKFAPSVIACQEMKNDGDSSDLRDICELATTLAQLLFQNTSEFHDIFYQAEQNLGLGQDTVNEILVQAFTQVDESAAQFNLESKKDRDLLSLMEKANLALGRILERMEEGPRFHAEGPLPSLDSVPREEPGNQFTLQAIAHEIRNPLTAVAGFTRRLAKVLDPNSQGGRYAHLILNDANRLEKILSEMTNKP